MRKRWRLLTYTNYSVDHVICCDVYLNDFLNCFGEPSQLLLDSVREPATSTISHTFQKRAGVPEN